MSDPKKLKLTAKGFSILYVEDNRSLRKNAAKLLGKFFEHVEVAVDGRDGLAKFKKHHYPLVITDIKMPNMDGMTLIQKIKKIQPETKIIIMSAFDDKEYLIQSIELGVFKFLKKPVNLSEFTDVLSSAIKEIKHEHNTKLFYTHLKSIFNYQSSMVMMLNGKTPILANQIFLDFFDVENIEDFRMQFLDLGDEFMKHDGFLYANSGRYWLDVLKLNEKKLFHVKIQSTKNELKHFILKYQHIPEKDGHGILSFDDVTELNLLKLFDEKQSSSDDEHHDSEAMFKLLDVIQRNSAKIEMHNYYKGLSITNDAIISEVTGESVSIKTTYLQQKAIQFEKQTIIISEALPKALLCSVVSGISFETQTVKLKGLKCISSSPINRQTIRVVPDDKQTVSLFLGENKFHAESRIEDISLNAVKIRLNALPPGLEKGSLVNLDIVLELDKRPLIINTKARMLRKSESRHSFSVVFMFEGVNKSELVKYITKRQMAIIREFKGLQNG